MIQRHPFAAVLALGAAAVVLGCSPTGRATADSSPAPYASASGDTVDKARAEAEKAGEKIKEGAEKTGEVIKETARDVKHDAKPMAKDVGESIDATKQHIDVKAALLAEKSVDASHIDVDVDKDAKTLYLRGTVPSAAQKATAEKIARDKADGYAVRNELTVMMKP